MKAIILAAGQGTRLKKYTQNLPKGMLNFLGKTIIERQIDVFRNNGIEEIIIVKGFAAEKINYPNVKYYTNEAYQSTNMVESFLVAKEEFNDDVIVSYSDILFEELLLNEMIKANGDFVVAVDDNWKEYWLERYGNINYDTESLIIDQNNIIVSLGKENVSIDEIHSRYIGLLKFSRVGLQKILSIIEKDNNVYSNKPWKQLGKSIKEAYMTDLLQAIIETGEKVKAKRFQNGWIEFDTNDDYEKAIVWARNGVISKFINL